MTDTTPQAPTSAASTPSSGGILKQPAEPVITLSCETCGKAFATEYARAQHNKSKHGVDVPVKLRKPSSASVQRLPELPAFVPSPVDLASTSPFGVAQAVSSWTDVTLHLHGHSVSNITICGQVLESTAADGVVTISVAVVEDDATEEIFTVRCRGLGPDALKRKQFVLVTGSLRMSPTHEPATNKYYLTPIVHVSPPLGAVHVIDE